MSTVSPLCLELAVQSIVSINTLTCLQQMCSQTLPELCESGAMIPLSLIRPSLQGGHTLTDPFASLVLLNLANAFPL